MKTKLGKLHYEKFNDLVRRIKGNTDWFDEFIEMVKKYYIDEPCGGSLHIVLDDGNIGKIHIAWCAGLACGRKDEPGSDLANLLQHMTWNQRNKVYKSV